ncbi:hypothetical protein ABW21_db0209684 [Orbilia brochopaga]|nr:hypothetical protein ABW21_db0209684 [Drechslerella brochopaga]
MAAYHELSRHPSTSFKRRILGQTPASDNGKKKPHDLASSSLAKGQSQAQEPLSLVDDMSSNPGTKD